MKPLLLLVPLALCAGCASSGDTLRTRGWLGGGYLPVVASAFPVGEGPYVDPHRIVGVPAATGAERGALVTWSAEDTPVHAAGLRPGDLLLRVGDRDVGDGDDVREAVEALPPGSPVPLRYWRGGAVHETSATVGTETWSKVGSLRLGLGLGSKFDLWPFDDGIDVLGLVVAHTVRGVDPDSPSVDYLRASHPDVPLMQGPLRSWEVFLGVIGFGGGERVIAQQP